VTSRRVNVRADKKTHRKHVTAPHDSAPRLPPDCAPRRPPRAPPPTPPRRRSQEPHQSEQQTVGARAAGGGRSRPRKAVTAGPRTADDGCAARARPASAVRTRAARLPSLPSCSVPCSASCCRRSVLPRDAGEQSPSSPSALTTPLLPRPQVHGAINGRRVASSRPRREARRRRPTAGCFLTRP
jgi:hypothetical protein